MKKHLIENKKLILLGLGVTALAFTIYYYRFRKLKVKCSNIIEVVPHNAERAWINKKEYRKGIHELRQCMHNTYRENNN